MIKMIAIDLDGTLYAPGGVILPEVKVAVAKAKAQGTKIVICTGRPLPGFSKTLEELNLVEDGDIAISNNGALVQYTKTGVVLSHFPLTGDDWLDMEVAARKAGLHIHAITADGVYTPNRDIGKYTVHEATICDMPLYYRTESEIGKLEIAKVMMVDEPDVLDNGIAYLPFELFETYTMVKSTPYYLELMNKKASKGNAVKALAEKLYLDLETEVMAIGDEENDRSMLEAVGFPVVMENGKEALKKIAKEVTKPNTEAGVAYAIEQWVLN
ncbi:MAG: sugar-phosphatase [Streptococcaceae bacterium]|jgi:Cof subfamily protein (haloacid dehalogenase superfamily)|nr:sugar-phosphatase [Streptococcaceae bacterium]